MQFYLQIIVIIAGDIIRLQFVIYWVCMFICTFPLNYTYRAQGLSLEEQ